jgi:uncharacterized SAM-binding protein YcdF (DUF218 family)
MALLTEVVANLFLWIWLLAAILSWRLLRTQRRARRWAGAALVLLWLLATRPVAELALRPLERAYAAPAVSTLRAQGVRQVVVLTGGGYPQRGELESTGFPHSSAFRFLGGTELCARLSPGCRLVFSGSAGRSHRDRPTGLAMRDVAGLLRPGAEAVGEAQSGSTGEHPGNVRPLLAPGPFALVTSAFHMPRAMRVFRRAGLEPIAFPVDSLVFGGYGAHDLLPSIENLWKLDVALREYLALAFYAIK